VDRGRASIWARCAVLLSMPLALALVPARAVLAATPCTPPADVPEVPLSPAVLTVAGLTALGALALLRRRRRGSAVAVTLVLAAAVIPWAAGISGARPVVAASVDCTPPGGGGGSGGPSSGGDQSSVSAADSALNPPHTGASPDINLSLVLVAGGIALLSLGGRKPGR